MICAICSRPLPPDGPSQSRCADHLNTPAIAERQAMRQQSAASAALFREIMNDNLPGPINAGNPNRPGVYLVILQNAQGQHGGCYLWDGECWRGWVTMFDPPEWDPAEMHNCRVVDWMNPDEAVRRIYKHRREDEDRP